MIKILIQNFAATQACYTPQFFENTKEKNKENYFGDRYYLDSNSELLSKFIKQAELKFKINIKKINNTSGIDQRNLDHFKPHIDYPSTINIMIMLKGINSITNHYHSQYASDIPNMKRFTATLFIQDYEEL